MSIARLPRSASRSTPAQLATNDPRYLRRLARELNKQKAGVYLDASIFKTESNPRLCGKASYNEKDGTIHFPAFMGGGDDEVYKVPADKAAEAFMEGGGGQMIYASRSER